MSTKKINNIRDFIVKHSIIIFPVILIIVVAITVVIALSAGKEKENSDNLPKESSVEESEESVAPSAEEIPLVENNDNEVQTVINAYYNAKGCGDTDGMLAVSDMISETDLLYYAELAKYIDYYSDLDVFTKDGPEEGSVVAYVYLHMGITDYGEVPGYETLYICKGEDGAYYIKNQSNCSEEEIAFIKTLCEQVDVVEFNNRVNVEYNELMAEKPELLEYLGLLGEQVQIAVGEKLALSNAQEEPATTEEVPGASEGGETGGENPEAQVEEGPKYAISSTTVNVRSSDSEKADKLGKLTTNTKIQVLEVRVNGWTKVLYDGKEGFVKSDFLIMQESANGVETIGTVTATTNINVRAAASETSDRLGVLAGGETADLVAVEGDWCKIKYNGQLGYVKAEYVNR